MTREEAIKVLNMVESHGLADEAKKMAITALSQEQQSEWERDHEVLKAYADGQESMKPCWIPVSEKMPEEGTYLICTDKGYIATIMYDRSMGWLLDANIIAYMPLPQPYKAESEGKE